MTLCRTCQISGALVLSVLVHGDGAEQEPGRRGDYIQDFIEQQDIEHLMPSTICICRRRGCWSVQGNASAWVEPGAPVLSVLRRSGRRLQAAEVPNHHRARVRASASTAPRLPTRAPSRHAMGHPADQIPPSLGAPAVCSHCVRMDGGMGGSK